MADSPVRRLSRSPSPWRGQSRSRSRSPARSLERHRPRSRSIEMQRPRSRSRSLEMQRPGSQSRPLDMQRPRSRSRSLEKPRLRSRSRSPDMQRPRSPSRGRGRSRSRSPPDRNGGDTLYVTGLSSRVTERDLEEHFSKEGKVASCFLVVEPRTRISRGFAFVTMDSVEDANRCIKYLNQSVLEGRYITVERSKRKRPRTPTPGHYLGLKNTREIGYRDDRGGGGRYRGGYGRDDYPYRRSPRHSPYRGGRDYSPPRHSPYGGGRYRRERSRSPYAPYGSPDRRYARGPR
ncbi:serine/arginine-rich splicing factor SR45a isoform X1 [Vicia villosa]|uniref:serine/arginine-rich splicing factor SR45a isoform X1 n=1 Tax=Vicia villosa TaxID=3911 RepID=UPI00273C6F4C|nr:serine/arginine-rich splicing factor SR45a isoform X1 [Vicia villosa]